ncbi:MAG: undecaprenyl-diphosphate phosphatase, partial [Planctomycetota bacterium]
PWQRKFFHGDEHQEPADAHSFVDIEHLTWRRALLVGLMQCVAMWPGTSRSMMTIVGGMLVGLRPRQAAEFSFLLGLPTLGSACLYKAARNLAGDGPNMIESLGVAPLVVGVAVATISAAVAIRWLVGFLSRHGVALFGWYRIGLSAVLVGLLVSGTLRIEPRSEAGPAPPPTVSSPGSP